MHSAEIVELSSDVSMFVKHVTKEIFSVSKIAKLQECQVSVYRRPHNKVSTQIQPQLGKLFW